MPGLAHALVPYMGHESSASAQPTATTVEAGVAGSVLKSIFGGNG